MIGLPHIFSVMSRHYCNFYLKYPVAERLILCSKAASICRMGTFNLKNIYHLIGENENILRIRTDI